MRASGGTLKFRVLSTQECLWSDSTVPYLLTSSAFGSEGQFEALFPLRLQAFRECEMCTN